LTEPQAGGGGREEVEPPSVRDHLANERTLLAWVRTALTVVGLGFIVDRLALVDAAGRLEAYAGVGLVLLGGLIAAGGALSFLRARSEMRSGTYRPAIGLHLALVGAVIAGALVVAVFLLTTRPVI
jgi:putative membrane protein